MIFQNKPSIEGQHHYFEMYGDSGKLLATSLFFPERWQRLPAADCIIQGKPTVEVGPDGEGRWYFKIHAGM